jgi:hypothetical protein
MRVLLPSVLQAQIRPAVRMIDLVRRRMDGPNAAARARLLAGVERAMARS